MCVSRNCVADVIARAIFLPRVNVIISRGVHVSRYNFK